MSCESSHARRNILGLISVRGWSCSNELGISPVDEPRTHAAEHKMRCVCMCVQTTRIFDIRTPGYSIEADVLMILPSAILHNVSHPARQKSAHSKALPVNHDGAEY